MDCVDAALNYLDLGYSVIPLKDKRPLIPWQTYQQRCPTPDEILGWWKRWPTANVGIVTGPISKTTVADFDDRRTSYKYLKSWRGPISDTPHGNHAYGCYWPGIKSAVRVIPGLDIRSDGGYVVAPPSVINGVTYKWRTSMICEASALPSLPQNVKDILQAGGNAPSRFVDRPIGFVEGMRDDTLFHIATTLRRGGMAPERILDVLTFIGKHTEPPFPQGDIKTKVMSAINRESLEGLTGELRNFLDATSGIFTANEAYQCLGISSAEAKTYVRVVLSRLTKDGLIERVDNKPGTFRVIDKDCAPVDWQKCPTDFVDLWLPLGLDGMAGIQPGNIVVFAGAKDAGKTTWCMHTGCRNSRTWDVHYFSSEMAGSEFGMRVREFGNADADSWSRIKFYERGQDFQDVVVPGPGKLNIIDYLEVTKDFYNVGDHIAKIFRKLDGAVALIALQKAPSTKVQEITLGTGGRFSIEKARLYIALDRGKAKIVSCKYRRRDAKIPSPGGMVREFRILDGGATIKPIGDWDREAM